MRSKAGRSYGRRNLMDKLSLKRLVGFRHAYKTDIRTRGKESGKAKREQCAWLIQRTVKKAARLLRKVREQHEINTASRKVRIKGPECREGVRFSLEGYMEP